MWRLAIFGIGTAFLLTSVSAVAIHAAHSGQASTAGATNTALRQIGGAMGPAILGSIYAANIRSRAIAAAALNAALLTTAALLAIGAIGCILITVVNKRVAPAPATDRI